MLKLNSFSVKLKSTLAILISLIICTWPKLYELFSVGSLDSLFLASAYMCFYISLALVGRNFIINSILTVVSHSSDSIVNKAVLSEKYGLWWYYGILILCVTSFMVIRHNYMIGMYTPKVMASLILGISMPIIILSPSGIKTRLAYLSGRYYMYFMGVFYTVKGYEYNAEKISVYLDGKLAGKTIRVLLTAFRDESDRNQLTQEFEVRGIGQIHIPETDIYPIKYQ